MNLHEGKPQEAGVSSAQIERVRRLGRQWVERGKQQTLVLLAARRGVIVLHEAFGPMYPDPDAPDTQFDTIFPMSSISKVVTATCAMQLVEDGLLGLNRPVQEYIPEFIGEGKEQVMVHHLFTHTSGWDEDVVEKYVEECKGTVKIPSRPETQHPALHEVLTPMFGAPLTRRPGTEMSYCSHGYNVVGEIVRRISGQSLNDFAHERIFQPLGMKDTTYGLSGEEASRVVRRRPLTPEPFGLDSAEYWSQPWAESGLLSTALDMAVFAQMFLNAGEYNGRQILSPASVREMTRNQIPGVAAQFFGELFPEAGWGYGWEVKIGKKALQYGSLDSPASFGHGGSGGPYVWADPVYDLVGVYLSVSPIRSPEHPVPDWTADLFINALTAATL